jgi:cobalt-zinc-cadmium efflux system membrane fusion protein
VDDLRTRSATSGWLLAAVGLGLGCFLTLGAVLLLGALSHSTDEKKGELEKEHEPFPDIQLAKRPDGKLLLDTIVVPPAVLDVLHVGKVQAAKKATDKLPLVMPGSTALDPSRIGRVRARFSGEVREIVDWSGRAPPGSEKGSIHRELRTGDLVEKGKPLAILWSVDVGSKKSDLVDALVQLHLDRKRLEAREKLFAKGSIPEDTLNQTRRDLITDENTVERARRTLETWQIPNNEVAEVEAEASKVIGALDQNMEYKRDKEKEKKWARSVLLAPNSGTIVERNISVGEIVSDPTANLFVIADVDNLLVLAGPPEDRLPELVNLKEEDCVWSLNTVGVTPDLQLPFNEISYLIDQGQHTALVKGYLPNVDYLTEPDKRDPTKHPLRSGQFVTATVNLDPPRDVVEVPLNAIVEDGGRRSYLFVQKGPNTYTLRRVVVTHRFARTAFVKSVLKDSDKEPTQEDLALKLPVPEALEEGDLYLPSGILELRAALEDLKVKAEP